MEIKEPNMERVTAIVNTFFVICNDANKKE